MEKKCYFQGVVGEPNGCMVVGGGKRKVERRRARRRPPPPRVHRALKKQKRHKGEVKPWSLFQEEPELITDEVYEKQQASSSSSSASTAKHMMEEREPEWMVMLKSLMAHQTQELKRAVGAEGNRQR